MNTYLRGTWVAQMVKHLPSAQVMIPGSLDQAPRVGLPAQWGACFSFSLCPAPLFVRVLSLSQINKSFFFLKSKSGCGKDRMVEQTINLQQQHPGTNSMDRTVGSQSHVPPSLRSCHDTSVGRRVSQLGICRSPFTVLL